MMKNNILNSDPDRAEAGRGGKKSMQQEAMDANPKGGALKTMAIILIIAVVAVAGYLVFSKTGKSSAKVVDSTKYQAVFLTNGQVYFGKVSNENSSYVSLAEVHYLILKKPLQNQQKEGDENQEQAKPEYSLIKLGSEMHGPSSMSVNRDQILFIENLKDDSKVVTTIKGAAK